MVTLQYLSRICLIYLLVTIISSVIFGANNYFKRDIKNGDCNYKTSDLGDASLVFHGFSVIILTIITFNIIIAWTSFEELTERNLNEIIIKSKNGALFCYILYFGSSIIFFYEWMIEIQEGECNTEPARIYSIFGKIFYLWCFFGNTTIISYFIIKNFLKLIFSLLKDANLFSICKEIKNRKISGNNKEIQTELMVLIPMIENKEKISLNCMICLESPIELLFDCNHSCTCNNCYKKLDKKECPYCRKKITNIKTIFLCGENLEKEENKINLPNTPLVTNNEELVTNSENNSDDNKMSINIGIGS